MRSGEVRSHMGREMEMQGRVVGGGWWRSEEAGAERKPTVT